MRYWKIDPESQKITEVQDYCGNLTAIADQICADRVRVQHILTSQGTVYYAPEPRSEDSFLIDGIHFVGLSLIASTFKPGVDFV